MPAHKQLAGGRWTADERDGLSVEKGLSTTLGVKLGDTLRFDIAGQLREGRITSLRKVDWGSMRVNFSWNPSPWVPLMGTAAGALLALAAGWWGLREVLRRPVLETLWRAGAV